MQIKILTPLCGAINAKPGDVVDVENEGLIKSLLSAKFAVQVEVETVEVETVEEEKPKSKKRGANKGAV